MRFAITLVLGAALLSSPAAAQTGGNAIPTTTPSLTISLGTATPGGGFPLYGNAFAQAMNAADPQAIIAPRNTKGSNENIPLLEKGELDLALVAGEPAYEAFAGIGRAPVRLKILTAIYSNPGMFVVRADSPYKTIRDLVGQPVAFGAKGSGLPILARYVLDGLGLRQDEDFKAVYLDRAGDGPAMVEDGRVAALWGAGIGWPGFAAVASSGSGARFIAPSAEEITRIRAKHAFLKPLTVPAGSYPNAVRADCLAGVLELCADARRSARRCRLSPGEDASRCRADILQAARASLRDHGREHGRRRAEARADPSRRDEVFSRDRGGEVARAAPRFRPSPLAGEGGAKRRMRGISPRIRRELVERRDTPHPASLRESTLSRKGEGAPPLRLRYTLISSPSHTPGPAGRTPCRPRSS